MAPKAGRGRGGGRGPARGGGRGPARGGGRGAVVKRRPAPSKPGQVKTKPQQAGRHTLLLTQVTASPETSRWRQFTSLASALDAFITMFEIQYKKMNPTLVRLQYTAKDLNAYVDSLHDASVMIVNTQHQMYQPRGRDFLKSELTNRLIAMSAKK